MWLQWGRRFLSAERLWTRQGAQSDPVLQWGRRFLSAEREGKSKGFCQIHDCFNGAADFYRRKGIFIIFSFKKFCGFNGAADFYRRKVCRGIFFEPGISVLQWGRRFLSAERRDFFYSVGFGEFCASMGPPIFIGGKLVQKVTGYRTFTGFNGAADFYRRKAGSTQGTCKGICRASMGPPIFIGGKGKLTRKGHPHEKASMGPPIFIGGKVDIITSPGSPSALLQWGRRFLSAERPLEPGTHEFQVAASMGPPIFIGGKRVSRTLHGYMLVASMGPPIFIGGKCEKRKNHCNKKNASMGPPIFIGGKSCRSFPATYRCLCFNGAADFYRRKVQLRRVRHHKRSGFNGAADFYRRKVNLSKLTQVGFDLLQWGRRFLSAESRGGGNHSGSIPGLQWGRRFLSAESITYPGRYYPTYPLQWGRRFLSAERLIFHIYRDFILVSFNGAADFYRRKGTLGYAITTAIWPRFNGAADFYRRKEIKVTRSGSWSLCFNGAADFYRRKG